MSATALLAWRSWPRCATVAPRLFPTATATSPSTRAGKPAGYPCLAGTTAKRCVTSPGSVSLLVAETNSSRTAVVPDVTNPSSTASTGALNRAIRTSHAQRITRVRLRSAYTVSVASGSCRRCASQSRKETLLSATQNAGSTSVNLSWLLLSVEATLVDNRYRVEMGSNLNTILKTSLSSQEITLSLWLNAKRTCQTLPSISQLDPLSGWAPPRKVSWQL